MALIKQVVCCGSIITEPSKPEIALCENVIALECLASFADVNSIQNVWSYMKIKFKDMPVYAPKQVYFRMCKMCLTMSKDCQKSRSKHSKKALIHIFYWDE